MSDHPTHSDPIDEEYEPADTTEVTPAEDRPARSGGPGWVSLTFVALIALAGAGLSVWSSGLLQQTGLLPANAPGNAAMQRMSGDQLARAYRNR